MDTVVKIEALAIMPSVIKSKTLLSVSGNKKKTPNDHIEISKDYSEIFPLK